MHLKLQNLRLLDIRQILVLLAVVLFLCATVAGLFAGQTARAATSSTVNFQARLMNAAGNIAPDGNYNVEFKIYDTASSGGTAQGACTGNCKWIETRTGGDTVAVANGFLAVNLGSVTAFGAGINWDQELWITMRVGGTGAPSWDTEMSPRLKLTAVPYAFRAGQLNYFNSTTGFSSNLSFGAPTGGNQNFVIPDQGAAGTYNVLTTATAATSFVQLQGATPGTPQTGHFNITGTAIVGTLQAATIDSPSGTTTLNIGQTNATANVNLGSSSVTNVSLQAAGAINVGTNANNKTISIGATGSTANTTTVNIANSTGAAQTVNIGSTNGASAITLNVGTGNFVLDGVGASTYTLGAATTSGTITIGGTAQTGDISIGTGTGAQSLNFGTGGTGAKTVTVGSTASTGGTTIQSGTGDTTVQSADQVFLNAGSTIELQDSTNITGNLGVTGTYNTNTFTGSALTFGSAATATIQSAASQALTITANAASTWSTSTGDLTVQAASNLNLRAPSGNVAIGTSDTTGTPLVVDIKTNAGDPTGTDGAIYYNSSGGGSFRCYQGGAWTNCITATGGLVSLQNAYDNGNTISTDGSGDIAFTLNNQNFTVATAAGATGSTTFSLTDGSNASPATQLVLISNNDVNEAIANGLTVASAAGTITDGLDVSDADITNAINIGANDILSNGVSIASAELNLLDGHDVALVDTNDAVNTAITGTGALNSGSITSGFGAIDTGADNITTTGAIQGGTATFSGANALTLGTTGTSTGAILFKGSTGASGTITFIGPANPSNNTITLPNETGTVCTTGSVCAGYQASGNYANTSLSNLTSVAINTSLLPGTTTIDLGSAAAPFRDLYLGGTATNNFRFTGTATSARTLTLDDLSGSLALVQTAGSSTAQTGDINASGTIIGGTALQSTLVKSADAATGGTSGLTVRSGNGTTSGNTGTVTIASGNATSGNSGNLTVDAGTASGTAGTITVAGANASALTLGRSGLTTSNAGALTVTQLLTGNAGLTVTGGAVQLNVSSNNNTAINTGTSTGTVTIGNGSAGAIGLQSGSTIALTGTNVSITTGGVVNPSTGFQIAGAAASGNYLRGNGTNFVSSAIQSGDLPDLGTLYIKNQTSQQASSNFNISGTGVAGVALQAPLFQTTDVTGASAAVTFRSGNSTTSGNTGTVTVVSGNATSGNSGNVSLDAGTASGTAGTVSIGTVNASGLTLGRTGLTTSNAGALTVGQLLTASGGISVAANQSITMVNGTGVLGQTFTNSAASSAQTLSVTNSNNGGSSIAVNGHEITLVGTATSGGINSNSAFNFANPSAAANNNFYGLNFAGTGYTDILRVSGTQIISGAGKIQNAALDSTVSYTNLTQVGALTSGSIASGFGTISTGNNITTTAAVQGGTGTFTGANALTLGTTGTNTGAIVFRGSTGASGTITLVGAANPSTNNYTLTIPALTANANVCTDNSICSGYAAAPTTGNFIRQVPASTAENTIAPTANSVVALTVKGTTGTAANVMEIFDSTATPALQAYFNSAGSLNVSQVIQPTANNSIDLGLSGTRFRTGYFGTSVSSPSYTGAGAVSLTSGGANALTLETGGAAAINIGTVTATSVSIGRSGQTTTVNGALTATELLTASGGVTVAANQNLTMSNGTGVLGQTFTNSAASSAQTLSVTNSNSGGTSVAVNGHNISLVGTATSGGINSNSAFNFANPSAAANNNFYGLNFAGTGYTDILRVNGNQIINGSGVLQSGGLSGTYSNALTLNNASNVYTGTTYNGLALTSAADGFTVAGGTTSRTLTVTGANITVGNVIEPTSAGALTVRSNGANALTLTGGASSTWDVNGTLSLQTTNNGAITTGTGLLTQGGNVTFSGTSARTITGPSTGGLTMTVDSGPLSLSTTTSGTLAVTSAGAVNLTGAANSTWTVGANTLGITSSNFNVSTGGVVNVSTGYQIAGAATSGNYLRGNGTNFVSSAIQAGDLPDLGTAYIKNQTSQQASSNFNISGTGVAGVALQAPLIQTADVTGASSAITLRSGNSTTSGNTGAVAIASGNATSGDSGNVGIDSGTASGTTGTITLGGTNASAITLGRSGITTTSAGALSVVANQNFTLQSGTGIFTQTYSNTTGTAATFAVTDSASSGATTVQGVAINLTGTNNGAGSNTITGLNFGNVAAATNNSYYGINFGTGLNDLIRYNGNQIISGVGKLQDAAIDSTLTYSNLQRVGALSVGSIASGFGTISTTNNISTTAAIQGGSGAFTGGTVTLGTTSQQGSLVLHDGNGETATISVGSALGANTAIAIPTTAGATDTFCLQTAANCGTAGANQQLSNLSGTVAVNLHLSPGGATNTLDVGTTSQSWRTGYFGTSLQAPLFTTAVAAGAVTVQGGNATSGNTNGGNITLTGGTGFGTGVRGLVVIDTPTITTAGVQNCSSNCSITQANIDSAGAVLINATNPSLTVTLSDPTIATAGRLMYVTNTGVNDFTLSVNGGGAGNTIAMKPSTTATMIWNGSDWTAAGASSSTDLQSAYNNTLTSAGGAELVLNAPGGSADGLTIRNNATTPIVGGILEVQTSIGSNLLSVNNNATEYATNGGAETAGSGGASTFPSNTWDTTTGGTVDRWTTAGDNIATGQASVRVQTTTTNHGARNRISTTLTSGLTYTASFAVRGAANFSTLDVRYSPDGTTSGTTQCATAQVVTSGIWTRITCSFVASGTITSSNSMLIRQTDATARTFYIDNLSINVSASATYAADGSVDDVANFATNWTNYQASGTSTVARETTTIFDTSGSARAILTATAGIGLRNNLAITPQTNTQYLVSFYMRSTTTMSGTVRVGFLPAGGTGAPSGSAACTDYNTQSLTADTWTEVTCLFTTDGTTITDADLVVYQSDASARTIYVDALSITLNTNNSNNVQVGGANKGGPTTLFTLDRSNSAPIAANNEAYLGSMYYDTTSGRIQCYEADGWGACGAAPDNIVNLNPEYAGAVLNGGGTGTMTADFCADQTSISFEVNDTLCDEGQAKNFYKWTSPQANEQTYSIYVTYQLPATFNGFSSDDTVQLVGRVDNTTNASVTYQMYKSTGSAITQCGSGETNVITGGGGSANTWYSYGINGNEATGCSFNSASAGNFVIFKINVKAKSNASAYVSTLSFTTTGR